MKVSPRVLLTQFLLPGSIVGKQQQGTELQPFPAEPGLCNRLCGAQLGEAVFCQRALAAGRGEGWELVT